MITVTQLNARVTQVKGTRDLAVFKKNDIWTVRDRQSHEDVAHEPTKEYAMIAAKRIAK